jgi:hypothetical protein
MLAGPTRLEDELMVSVVESHKTIHMVPLLVDTGGTISIAGTMCKHLFHEKDITPTTPIPVRTVSGIMTLDTKWTGTLGLHGALVKVSLYLAPLYTGGIIFGVDIQNILEISITTARGYRDIDFALLGVKCRSSLQDGGCEWHVSPRRTKEVVVIHNLPLSPFNINELININRPTIRTDNLR